MRKPVLADVVPSVTWILVMLATGATAPRASAEAMAFALSDSAAARASPVSNAVPVLDLVEDMLVDPGGTADQSIRATDADGDPLSFTKGYGPSFMALTTLDPGTGIATGNIHVTPALTDSGLSMAAVIVSDGIMTRHQEFRIGVGSFASRPALTIPDSITAVAGSTTTEEIYATDGDADPLTFFLVSGPYYVTVETTDEGLGFALGSITVSPPPAAEDTLRVTVAASDGVLADERSTTVVVLGRGYNTDPILETPPSMAVHAGSVATASLRAIDPDGDPLHFSKVAGPAYMSVATVEPGTGTAEGRVELRPSSSETADAIGTVGVDDGLASDEGSFTITMLPPDNPPVMLQPADMFVAEGAIVEQSIEATDPDGDVVIIRKVRGPAYMSVAPVSQQAGTTMAKIVLSPGAGTYGLTTGSVGAFSFALGDTATFGITIGAEGFPPQCTAAHFQDLTAPLGPYPYTVAAGDLDSDGRPDLVTGSYREEEFVSVLFGLGGGAFRARVGYPVGGSARGVTLADFNGDSRLDIAAINADLDFVRIYLGDGLGGFADPRDFGTGIDPLVPIVAELNADGVPDLVVARSDGVAPSVLLGVGDGTFSTRRTVPVNGASDFVAAGDLNGDAADDLVVTQAELNRVVVLLNDGTGVFTGTTLSMPPLPLGVALADLDLDGRLDLIVGRSHDGGISVSRGLGDGTFESPARAFSGALGGPQPIPVLDVNGDLKPDLIAGVNLHLGDGAANLSPATSIAAGGCYGLGGTASADFDQDSRPDIVAFHLLCGGLARVLLNRGCAPSPDAPPEVAAPALVGGREGVEIQFEVVASDPDGAAIDSLIADFSALPAVHGASFVSLDAGTRGVFTWTPSYQDAYSRAARYYYVSFVAFNALSGAAVTTIAVSNTNRPPVADAGGPYSAVLNVPIQVDGSSSADPDGQSLSYQWSFGDGGVGTGISPSHAYRTVGEFVVTLTVSDGAASDLSSTTATVPGVGEARAFVTSENSMIRLAAGARDWSVRLEPVGGSYLPEDLIPSSIRLSAPGFGSVGEIPAIAVETISDEDLDANGIAELNATFGKDALRELFSDLEGRVRVTVAVRGAFPVGSEVEAPLEVEVDAGATSNLSASVVPNPINPSGVLTFRTATAGRLRVVLFDTGGRAVRMLLDESWAPAGYHEIELDARNSLGNTLGSGLYFYRIEAEEGTARGRLTILK